MGKIVKFKTDQTPEKIAYLAGIIDGEGCFYIGHIKQGKYGSGFQWHSLLKISSCDVCLIEWLEINFGGACESRHRYTSKRKFERPVYAWNMTGTMLDHFLPLLYPYFVIKRKHCEIMIEYRKTSKNIGSKRLSNAINTRRLELMKQMRSINTRFHNHPLKNPSALSPSS
jgi:hypothetical protein